MQQKITPNLWFNGNAKEAVEYFASAFPDAYAKMMEMKELVIADF